MAEIQLRNVSKRWGSFVGVDDFNLTIADQEFLVLLGPSGTPLSSRLAFCSRRPSLLPFATAPSSLTLRNIKFK